MTCGLCAPSATTPPESPTTEATTSPEPPSSSGPAGEGQACVDTDPHCAKSYKNFCYLQNIKESCPMTCGLCAPSATTPPESPSSEVTTSPEPPSSSGPAGEGQACVDTDPHCAKSYNNFCYLQNIKESCPMTCGLCTPSATAE